MLHTRGAGLPVSLSAYPSTTISGAQLNTLSGTDRQTDGQTGRQTERQAGPSLFISMLNSGFFLRLLHKPLNQNILKMLSS